MMATEHEKELYLSVFHLDESTSSMIDWLIESHILPIQRQSTGEIMRTIYESTLPDEDKQWLLSFLR